MIRTWMMMAVAVLAFAAAPAARQADDLGSPKLRIAWAEFKKLYDDKKAEVVDVRDPDSFAAGRIPGSRNVPLEQVERRTAELKKLNRPIVVYCA